MQLQVIGTKTGITLNFRLSLWITFVVFTIIHVFHFIFSIIKNSFYKLPVIPFVHDGVVVRDVVIAAAAVAAIVDHYFGSGLQNNSLTMRLL